MNGLVTPWRLLTCCHASSRLRDEQLVVNGFGDEVQLGGVDVQIVHDLATQALELMMIASATWPCAGSSSAGTGVRRPVSRRCVCVQGLEVHDQDGADLAIGAIRVLRTSIFDSGRRTGA